MADDGIIDGRMPWFHYTLDEIGGEAYQSGGAAIGIDNIGSMRIQTKNGKVTTYSAATINETFGSIIASEEFPTAESRRGVLETIEDFCLQKKINGADPAGLRNAQSLARSVASYLREE